MRTLPIPLIRRSSLLLALWDGRASQLSGGTADTVLRYLGVRTDENVGIEPVEVRRCARRGSRRLRPARLLDTGRAQRRRLASDSRSPCFLLGVGENVLQVQQTMPSWLKHQLAELNGYNLEFRRLERRRPSRDRGFPDGGTAASLPLSGRRPLETSMPSTARQMRSPFIISGARTVCSICCDHGVCDGRGVPGLRQARRVEDPVDRLLLTRWAAVYIPRTAGQALVRQAPEYRALAETLRARFYLRLAGTDHRVDAAEVLALSGIDRFRASAWIGFVLKGSEPPDVRALAGCELDVGDARR